MSQLVIHDEHYTKCFYVKIAENLLHAGVHTVRILLRHPNGWMHQHTTQFLGDSCGMWIYGDLNTQLSIEIDGMQVPTTKIRTTQHRNLYNLVTRLLSTGPQYKI